MILLYMILSPSACQGDTEFAVCRLMKHALARILQVCVLAGMVLLSSGCVYWRLNQFRNQLSAFPDYYRIEERELPTIVAMKPVLQPDDLGWLSGLPASETVQRDGNTLERYHFVKQYAGPDEDEEGAYDIVLLAHFNEDGRLHEYQAPARFAPLLTEENFEEVFRPMKDGHVERLQQATGWVWEEHKVNIPVREAVRDFLGAPYEVEERGEGLTYTYVYQLQGNDERWNPTGWDMYARFVFEPEEERVVHTESYMGRLQVIVDLRARENLVEIKRL